MKKLFFVGLDEHVKVDRLDLVKEVFLVVLVLVVLFEIEQGLEKERGIDQDFGKILFLVIELYQPFVQQEVLEQLEHERASYQVLFAQRELMVVMYLIYMFQDTLDLLDTG